MAKTKVVICPYCGDTQPNGERCRGCGGFFEPLSRQATHNAMGPWFIRDQNRPFQPGCSYETLVMLIERGQLDKYTIIRGPTTKQFWSVAKRVNGIAHLLGYCYACDSKVDAADHGCPGCGVPFGAFLDRNYMGLPEIQPLPWEAQADDDGEPTQVSDFAWGTESPSAGRLSSFATDEELLAPTIPPDASNGESAGMRQTTPVAVLNAPAPAAATPPPAATSTEFDHSSSATRSLQRRVASQVRTIRTLMILVVILILTTIITAVILVSRGTAGGADPVAPGGPDDNSSTPANVVADDPEDGPRIDEPEAMRDHDETTPPLGTIEEPPADDSPATDASDVADPPDLVADARAAAAALVERASETDRPLAERLSDYAAAIAELEDIPADAMAVDDAVAITAEIDRIRLLRERLELSEFFDD